MSDANVDRSKLVQKQKQQRLEVEKKLKKAKGNMKEAVQDELEELEGKHAAELAKFDKGEPDVPPPKGAAGEKKKKKKDEEVKEEAKEDTEEEEVKEDKKKKKKKKKAKEDTDDEEEKEEKEDKKAFDPPERVKEAKEAKEDKAPAASSFRERQWAGLSKKELEEECVLRGLGKKGGKEELTMKLITFHQDLKVAGVVYKAADSDDSDEDDEDEEDSDDEEDEDDAEPVTEEEMAKQGKREEFVRKGIKYILKENPDGFPVSELSERLAAVKLTGFAPEKMGYKSVEKFLKGQPETLLLYKKKKQMIMPGRKY